MIRYELYFNDQLCDLSPSTKVATTYQPFDFFSLTSRFVTHTNTIKLPFTETNDLIFRLLRYSNVKSGLARGTVRLVINGIEQFRDYDAQVTSVSDGYNLNINAPTLFFDKLKGTFISISGYGSYDGDFGMGASGYSLLLTGADWTNISSSTVPVQTILDTTNSTQSKLLVRTISSYLTIGTSYDFDFYVTGEGTYTAGGGNALSVFVGFYNSSNTLLTSSELMVATGSATSNKGTVTLTPPATTSYIAFRVTASTVSSGSYTVKLRYWTLRNAVRTPLDNKLLQSKRDSLGTIRTPFIDWGRAWMPPSYVDEGKILFNDKWENNNSNAGGSIDWIIVQGVRVEYLVTGSSGTKTVFLRRELKTFLGHNYDVTLKWTEDVNASYDMRIYGSDDSVSQVIGALSVSTSGAKTLTVSNWAASNFKYIDIEITKTAGTNPAGVLTSLEMSARIPAQVNFKAPFALPCYSYKTIVNNIVSSTGYQNGIRWDEIDAIGGSEFSDRLSVTFAAKEVQPNDTGLIEWDTLLPKIDQHDFFKDFVIRFGLLVYPEYNTIICRPIEYIIQDPTNVVDLTGKRDLSLREEINFVGTPYFRKNFFKDSDEYSEPNVRDDGWISNRQFLFNFFRHSYFSIPDLEDKSSEIYESFFATPAVAPTVSVVSSSLGEVVDSAVQIPLFSWDDENVKEFTVLDRAKLVKETLVQSKKVAFLRITTIKTTSEIIQPIKNKITNLKFDEVVPSLVYLRDISSAPSVPLKYGDAEVSTFKAALYYSAFNPGTAKINKDNTDGSHWGSLLNKFYKSLLSLGSSVDRGYGLQTDKQFKIVKRRYNLNELDVNGLTPFKKVYDNGELFLIMKIPNFIPNESVSVELFKLS